MFEQHPVPQQISSYQFRLVGDMTLKQFFQLAAGAVIALIIYSLPLPAIFKWPLVVIAAISGAAFAFLPLQDRPLEKWLAAFFRAIYQPTIFTWKKTDVDPMYFTPEGGLPAQPQTTEEKHLEAQPSEPSIHAMETNEANFLSKVTGMIKHHDAPPPQPAPASDGQQVNVQPTQVVQATVPQPEPQSTGGTVTVDNAPEQKQPVKKELVVPKGETIKVENKGYTEEVKPDEVKAQTQGVAQTLSSTQQSSQGIAAQFSPDAAPPLPPTQPNIIVGQVMDSNKKIVESAILEVTDEQGRPVRALKTNKAGHFQIVTSLPDGKYKIIIEKEGLEFDDINIEATGQIIEPIAISSKNPQSQ